MLAIDVLVEIDRLSDLLVELHEKSVCDDGLLVHYVRHEGDDLHDTACEACSLSVSAR
jgi:hypothetical protein